MIDRTEMRLEELDREEASTDSSDWEKLAALKAKREKLEEEIFNLYMEKENLESRPPDD